MGPKQILQPVTTITLLFAATIEKTVEHPEIESGIFLAITARTSPSSSMPHVPGLAPGIANLKPYPKKNFKEPGYRNNPVLVVLVAMKNEFIKKQNVFRKQV